VTEEKKKIFRARKTMKISDRLQLESLHSTLLTATPDLSNPSPPPLVNGTHKEDGQKVGDKEQNNISDSNSPHASPASATSLSSPAPFLSLNLSPSPASSQSPKSQEETSSPTSPFQSVFFDLKKMEDDEKKGSSPSSSNETVPPASAECKDQSKKDTDATSVAEKKEVNAKKRCGFLHIFYSLYKVSSVYSGLYNIDLNFMVMLNMDRLKVQNKFH